MSSVFNAEDARKAEEADIIDATVMMMQKSDKKYKF